MAPWLILAIGGVYVYVAADLWLTNQNGLALAYLGYAFANVGLFMAAK